MVTRISPLDLRLHGDDTIMRGYAIDSFYGYLAGQLGLEPREIDEDSGVSLGMAVSQGILLVDSVSAATGQINPGGAMLYSPEHLAVLPASYSFVAPRRNIIRLGVFGSEEIDDDLFDEFGLLELRVGDMNFGNNGSLVTLCQTHKGSLAGFVPTEGAAGRAAHLAASDY